MKVGEVVRAGAGWLTSVTGLKNVLWIHNRRLSDAWD